MARHPNRREFLQTTAAVAGVGFFSSVAAAQDSKSPNERIRFGCVGVTGKGQSDSGNVGRNGDVVAICDIDDGKLNAGKKRFAKAKTYNDYRKMFEEAGKDIDAVTVSTPDHMHAVIAAMAMKMGKHVYCQKPLTHDIYEARKLGEIAREMKVATQMGNQGTVEPGLRKAAAMLRGGLLGAVSHVHVWTNRPIWDQGKPRPEQKPVPPGVHWDLWLGTAPYRPYANGYHDFAWRGWWDFGTGALGDMACHTVNMPYMGLELRDHTSVQAVTTGHNGDSYPRSSKIDFEFPANDWRGALKFTWYDGGNMPARESLPEKFLRKNRDSGAMEMYASGCMIVGEKGKLFSPDDYARRYVLDGVEEPDNVEFERSPGGNEDPGHVKEWVLAIQGGKPARSNFPDYAGPLTETILLGNLAVYAAKEADVPGKKVEWNAKEMKATNAPELAHIVKREYRAGYSL
jgi:predicted dehydrogenase